MASFHLYKLQLLKAMDFSASMLASGKVYHMESAKLMH